MKEIKPGLERLTSYSATSTLRSERTMAEQGEIPKKVLPDEKIKASRPSGKERVSREEQEAARRRWAEFYKGKTFLPNERETIEDLINRGISPQVAPESTPDAKLYGQGSMPGPGAMAGPPSPTAAVAEDLLGGGQELQTPRYVENYITNRGERDKFFNSVFELVDASPHELFQQAFTFENQVTLTRFMNVIMKASRDPRLSQDQRLALGEDFERYQLQRRIKEGAHNVNAILYIPSVKADQLFEHLQSIESLLGDAAHRVLGVVEMSNILERVLREEMRKNNGYLRPEAITGRVETDRVQRIDPATGALVVDVAGNPIYDDVIVKVREGDVERRVKEIFNEYVSRNHGVYARAENGQSILISKEFQPWEIDSVFTTARATMIMSERLLSIAAEGKMGEGGAHYSSLFLQDILQGYSAIVHTVGKFGITEENMAILLHDPDEKIKKVFGLLSAWNPQKYEEAYKEFVNNPKAILESENEFFAIQKQNPNRVGDMLTLQAWRYIENPDEPSAVQDFIARGRERMKDRWDTYHLGDPTSDEYEEFIHRTAFTVPRNAKKQQKNDILKARGEAWEAAHPGAPSLEEYINYANEYFKWIGTAVRFDLLRITLDGLAKPPKGDGEALKLWKKQIASTKKEADKAKAEGKYGEYRKKQEKLEKLESVDKLIERMVKLQPHRLYDKSLDIRRRINDRLFTFLRFPDEAHQTPAERAVIEQLISNFYLVENTLFRDRERLLESGKTFDSNRLSLNEFLRRTDIITDPNQRHLARKFLQFSMEDYRRNKDKYLVEFVYRRDYKHGFMLWSGDVPLNEYRLTALGPTGSFVRRARDNKTTGEATVELFKLMGTLPEFQSLEQAIPSLKAIHDKIAIYSPSRAKEVVADISLGIAKFVAERQTTNIPGWGFIERRFLKPSFAKIIYGETGLSSGATEIRNFFNLLYKKEHLITEDKYTEITKDKIPASKLDTAVDITSTMSQLIALAIMLSLLNELFKSKS